MSTGFSTLLAPAAGPLRSAQWPNGLITLETGADAVLGLSLIAIAGLILILLVRSDERSPALTGMAWLFSLAMLVSGFEHLASLGTLWLPVDWLEGILKAAAALLVLLVAIMLWLRLPRITAISADRLDAEIAAHLLTREELRNARAELKARIDAHHTELSRVERRFELALRNSPITVLTQDADLRITWIYNPPAGLEPETLLGKTDAEILPDAAAASIIAAKRRAMETGSTQELETNFDYDGRTVALYLLIEPLEDAEGRPTGTITVAVDISQRKAQEMQLRLLLRELTHRSKNLLAVINAIARQTASRTKTIDDFLDSFNARLVAIGCAHDLLVADDWKGASLRTLVEAELSAHAFPRQAQVDVEGEDVMLKPDAVQNVGLALHELLSNARKYGALSNKTGQVHVYWQKPDGQGLRLIWEETGGPAVPRPDHFGFGRTMIENVVEKALDGHVILDFDPDGVRCEILIPPNQLGAA